METLEQIQAKMKQLEVQAEALLAKKTQAVVDQIRDIMLKHGLTTEDIGTKAKAHRQGKNAVGRVANGKAKPAATKGKLPAKYRDPKTGETWSGHARPPAWINNAKDRTKFLIAGASAPAAAKGGDKSKASAKPVSKVVTKSKLPPKYRDPKTGATWSGHARPPQWIAGVKDRSRFLIAGADEHAAAPKAAVAKKAAAKKAATKKAAAKRSVAAAKKTPAKKAAAQKGMSKPTPVAGKKAAPKKPAAKKAPAKKNAVKAKPSVSGATAAAEKAAMATTAE